MEAIVTLVVRDGEKETLKVVYEEGDVSFDQVLKLEEACIAMVNGRLQATKAKYAAKG